MSSNNSTNTNIIGSPAKPVPEELKIDNDIKKDDIILEKNTGNASSSETEMQDDANILDADNLADNDTTGSDILLDGNPHNSGEDDNADNSDDNMENPDDNADNSADDGVDDAANAVTESQDKNDSDPENSNGRPKRGLPKKFLANQQKYIEAMEKQQRMMNTKKTKKKEIANSVLKKTKQAETKITAPKEGLKRMIVAGKVVYVASKSTPETEIPVSKKNEIVVIPNQSAAKPSPPTQDNTEPPVKLPSALAKKMAIYNEKIKDMAQKSGNKIDTKNGKKIPQRYAKEIQKNVKSQTVKNVKNFSDLRRVKALENIPPDTDIDANKASIAELRKLHTEQRRREQAEIKKKSDLNKKESAIQDILKNDKMSKFAKTLAIKNLSVNSRHRRPIENKREDN